MYNCKLKNDAIKATESLSREEFVSKFVLNQFKLKSENASGFVNALCCGFVPYIHHRSVPT